MASWGQLCQRHVCTLRQYFCAHASHLNASFQYFTALATHVKPAFFRFWLAAVLYPVSVYVPLDRLSAVYWVSFTLVQSLRVSKLKNIHIRVLRGNTLARPQGCLIDPGGSEAGRQLNFGGLVLGCIDADFCKYIFVWIAVWFEKKIEKALDEIYKIYKRLNLWNPTFAPLRIEKFS